MDVVGGQASAIIDALPSSYPQVKAGRLKPLAVTSTKRVPFIPDVPTVAESGIRGFDMVSWHGLRGLRSVPKAITAKLTTETEHATRAPLAVARLGEQGLEPSRRRARCLRAIHRAGNRTLRESRQGSQHQIGVAVTCNGRTWICEQVHPLDNVRYASVCDYRLWG